MTSLVDKLVHHLFLNKENTNKGWVPKYALLGLNWRYDDGRTYLPSTVDRKLREAEENRRIAVKYEGKNTLYKWLPYERRKDYIPTSEREAEELFTTPQHKP